MEEEMNHREEDLILPFEELPSFVEDDEEEVVPPFREQGLVAEPLLTNEELLQSIEEYVSLQQTASCNMEDEKEVPRDSPILEEEHVDVPRIVLQPMHVIVAEIEEIADEDDLLDEFDFFCSSMDVESSSLTHEVHVLQPQMDFLSILVAPREVI
jgi:hypothetical protein